MNKHHGTIYNWAESDSSDESSDSDESDEFDESQNINDILDDVSSSDKESDDSERINKKKQDMDQDRAVFNDLCKKYGFDYTGMLQSSYGCEHYRNACKVYCDQCPDGKNIYPCHKCHNEHMMKLDLQKTMKLYRDNNPISKNNKSRKDNITKIDLPVHDMESEEIQYIQCIKCEHKQQFGKTCKKCKTIFCKYICFVCKLMDNRGADDYYHCNSCNCCLVGKRSDFLHCDKCETCVQKNKIVSHPCRKGMWDIDKLCSICQTGIRTQLSVIMVCGHIVHHDCFNVLTQNTYKCPECSKTIKDTRKIFEKLAREIDATPLHPDLQKKIKIRCNDCGEENTADFHYIGTRCLNDMCKSFNTYEI